MGDDAVASGAAGCVGGGGEIDCQHDDRMNYEALIVSVVVVVGMYALIRWLTLDVKCECGHELRDHYGLVLPMGCRLCQCRRGWFGRQDFPYAADGGESRRPKPK